MNEEEQRAQEEKEAVDLEIQNAVKAILAKEPSELTPHDREFLRARQSYVGKKSRAKFKEVFDEVVEEKKEVEEEEVITDPNAHPATVPPSEPESDDDGEDE